MAEFLLISPHVDDEVLGCGGILDERFHVHYCGVEEFRIVDRETRLAEAAACAGYLGFSYSVNLDNVVNEYQLAALIGQLEAVVNEQRPTTVFAPCPSYNQDHRAVLDATLVALRPHDINHQVANVLLYEQVHVVLWPHREDLLQGRALQPTCFIPIDIERKLEAYRRHASQQRAMRSAHAVQTLAAWRGLQSGFEHAEGFVVVRLTRPDHLNLGAHRRAERAADPG